MPFVPRVKPRASGCVAVHVNPVICFHVPPRTSCVFLPEKPAIKAAGSVSKAIVSLRVIAMRVKSAYATLTVQKTRESARKLAICWIRRLVVMDEVVPSGLAIQVKLPATSQARCPSMPNAILGQEAVNPALSVSISRLMRIRAVPFALNYAIPMALADKPVEPPTRPVLV